MNEFKDWGAFQWGGAGSAFSIIAAIIWRFLSRTSLDVHRDRAEERTLERLERQIKACEERELKLRDELEEQYQQNRRLKLEVMELTSLLDDARTELRELRERKQ